MTLNKIRSIIRGRVKLHLGCGKRKRKGWVNIDIDEKVEPDIVSDVKDLAMFEDESVDEIDCCHLFEHLTYSDAVSALKEWYRVLKKGGKLSLELPNFRRCVEILYENPNPFDWYDEKDDVPQKYAMGGIYGWIPAIKKIFQLHKYGWTPRTLTVELRKVGFTEIKQVPITQTWRKATKHSRDMRLECTK